MKRKPKPRKLKWQKKPVIPERLCPLCRHVQGFPWDRMEIVFAGRKQCQKCGAGLLCINEEITVETPPTM